MNLSCEILSDFVHGSLSLRTGQRDVPFPEHTALALERAGLVRPVRPVSPPPMGKAPAAGKAQASSALPAAPVSVQTTATPSAAGGKRTRKARGA